MKRTRKVICIVTSFVLALNFAAGLVFYLFEPESVRSDPAAPAPLSSNNGVIYLDQSWSESDRDTWYWIPQGTVVTSYDIFLNLECADSQELFRSDANIERYGLTPSPKNPATNPDGLPIGVTKEVTTEGRWKGVDAGVTCAACHNAELFYQGKRIRIDGDVECISRSRRFSMLSTMQCRRH